LSGKKVYKGLAKTAGDGYTMSMKDTLLKKGNIRWVLRGFMSAFDIGGQSLISIPDYKAGFQRDMEALRGDWIAVGGDIRRAMNQIADER
jgi:hypothetical protein